MFVYLFVFVSVFVSVSVCVVVFGYCCYLLLLSAGCLV